MKKFYFNGLKIQHLFICAFWNMLFAAIRFHFTNKNTHFGHHNGDIIRIGSPDVDLDLYEGFNISLSGRVFKAFYIRIEPNFEPKTKKASIDRIGENMKQLFLSGHDEKSVDKLMFNV